MTISIVISSDYSIFEQNIKMMPDSFMIHIQGTSQLVGIINCFRINTRLFPAMRTFNQMAQKFRCLLDCMACDFQEIL
jgi:hypothetical protein